MIKEYITALAEKGLREDGRGLLDYRKDISVEYGISSKSAEGSARVKIGDTEVVAGIKFAMGEPYPDKPGEGTIMVNAELLPLSNPKFESGPPSIGAIELSRVVDRCIRESGAMDFKKLCVKEGEKVWMVFIDIYSINDAGNLFDAASLAALAALKDARFPEFDKKTGKVNYEKKTKTKLELKGDPLEITVLKINGKLIVDPTLNEWENHDARLTVATLDNGMICALQKGGEEILTGEDVSEMVKIATDKAKMLRKKL
tara:strand:- start:433 stop:1206 length:774 start_codon:yes stop_codon:yes gene_type:complete